MNVDHEGAKEQKEAKLLPKGDYTFEVLAADEKYSQKGQEMLALSLAVYTGEGKKVRVKDWVGAWDWSQVQGLAEALGRSDDYAKNDFHGADIIGLTGTVHIRPGKDQRGEPSNTRAWYVPLRGGSAPVVPAQAYAPATRTVVDDDVPF